MFKSFLEGFVKSEELCLFKLEAMSSVDDGVYLGRLSRVSDKIIKARNCFSVSFDSEADTVVITPLLPFRNTFCFFDDCVCEVGEFTEDPQILFDMIQPYKFDMVKKGKEKIGVYGIVGSGHFKSGCYVGTLKFVAEKQAYRLYSPRRVDITEDGEVGYSSVSVGRESVGFPREWLHFRL